MRELIAPATIIEKINGKEVPFKDFLKLAVEGYEMFGKGPVNIRKGVKITDAIEASNGVILLEDDHYNSLKDAVNNIQWLPRFAMKAIAYFDAVENAKEVKNG